ncbi:MAG: type II 3-dehydroquinate dehydratase [Desulfobacterales bacterium]|nr:type II 3-dehydroquinate dehydratase [Desulfobacterales bacterium]MBS3754728.1 type II 3-dehydroquinate dehydratase [Desulfobacterales bacterium]
MDNKPILVIHGPNLNMLGNREPETYGSTSLSEINEALRARAEKQGAAINTFQSNHEGEIVEAIQQAAGNCSALIINPAAYTHTSVAIRDAVLLLEIPVIEVHLSNICKREEFRHKSIIADAATGQISGLGAYGYLLALDAALNLAGK